MSRKLIVLRPEPGCGETVAAARARGIEAVAAPLFDVEPVAWEPLQPDGFDGLLAGSANAFRLGGRGLADLTGLPVHAVGERTAEAARSASFKVASVGKGGLQALLETLEGQQRLLRLAGEARVALSAPPGIDVTERVVYRAVPRALAEEAITALGHGAVALLHSGEASRAFAAECERLRLERSRVSVAALAPRIADEAGSGWGAVAVAAEVSDRALLELATDMCQ